MRNYKAELGDEIKLNDKVRVKRLEKKGRVHF